MKKIKLTALILTAVFAVILLGACGNQGSDRSSVSVDLSDPRLHPDPVLARAGLDRDMRFLTTRTITVGIWDRATEADPTPENNFWTTYIREGMMREHNVNVEYIAIPRWTEVEFLNNLMAAGNSPDVISTFSYPTILTYANMGGIMDMAPLIRDYRHIMPSVVELLTDDNLYWNQDPRTGTIWAIPGRLAINPGLNLFVRQDWLDILGLSYPTNLQEFEAMLYAFQANASRLLPPGRSPSELIAFGVTTDMGWTARNLIGSFIDHNISDRDWFIHGFDDRFYTQPGTQDALRLLNRWYNDGLLWNDFALGGALGIEDYMKIGLVGAYMQNWDTPFRGGGVDINTTLQRMLGEQAYFAAVNPSPFLNNAGYPRRHLSAATDRTIAFPASNTEPVASLLYLEFITRQDNLTFMQFGVEGINHRRHPDGALEMIQAGAPHAINSVNNFDYTITINGVRMATPELTVRSLALSYPGIPAEHVLQAFYIPQSYDRSGRNVQVGEIMAESGIGPSLNELRNVAYSQSLIASPADFDRVWNQNMAAYLAAGGQAIMDERREAWQRVYGNAVNIPKQ